MSKFMDKIAGALGFSEPEDNEDNYDDYEEDDYEEEDEDSYESEPSAARSSYSRSTSSYAGSYGSSSSSFSRSASSRSQYPSASLSRSEGYHVSNVRSMQTPGQSRNNKVLNLHANVQMEVVVASPETFDEARDIAEKIKNGQPVIINLEFVAHDVAQRITDFLCGCCCAMDGNIQRIANKIFMIAPTNIDFASDVDIRQSLESGNNGLGFIYGDGQH